MSEGTTPETDFEMGAIYVADPATYIGTCPKCGKTVIHQVTTVPPVCGECNVPLAGDRQQQGERRYVILGSDSILQYENTVPAVPISAQENAARRMEAIRITPSNSNGQTKTAYILPTKLRLLNKTSFFKENRTGTLEPHLLTMLQDAILRILWE